jgi:hypothetical protein
MIEVEREPYPEWSKNARRKYRDNAAEIITKHVGLGEITGEPSVESCLAELREMFPSEFFRVEFQQSAEVDEHGQIRWRNKWANVMMLRRGFDNFPSKPTLSEAMNQVRTWQKETGK